MALRLGVLYKNPSVLLGLFSSFSQTWGGSISHGGILVFDISSPQSSTNLMMLVHAYIMPMWKWLTGVAESEEHRGNRDHLKERSNQSESGEHGLVGFKS